MSEPTNDRSCSLAEEINDGHIRGEPTAEQTGQDGAEVFESPTVMATIGSFSNDQGACYTVTGPSRISTTNAVRPMLLVNDGNAPDLDEHYRPATPLSQHSYPEGCPSPTPTTYDAPASDYDGTTKISDEEEADIETINAELQYRFEELMRANKKVRSLCHTKVAALLIDWVPEGEGYLDTGDEVEKLAKVLRDEFNFQVKKERLKSSGKVPPLCHQMEKILVDFKCIFDGDDTLLIIYYAGHGLTYNSPGQLKLQGSTTKPSLAKGNTTSIIWNEAERSIENTKADLLLIFDCCCAGQLAKSRRSPALGKIFEFLGATQETGTARGPGPYSFTSALIWALKECAGYEQGFTVPELLSKIKEAEHFRDNDPEQVPCFGERGLRPALQKLRIAPLSDNPLRNDQRRRELEQQQPNLVKFYLNLELLYSRAPTEDDIDDLVKDLRLIINNNESNPLLHVLWRGLSLESLRKAKFRDVARQIMAKGRRSQRSTDFQMESPAGNTLISIPKEMQTSITITGRDMRLPGKQNFIYAANIVQRKTCLLAVFSLTFILALFYMIWAGHGMSASSWSTLTGTYLAAATGAVIFGADGGCNLRTLVAPAGCGALT